MIDQDIVWLPINSCNVVLAVQGMVDADTFFVFRSLAPTIAVSPMGPRSAPALVFL